VASSPAMEQFAKELLQNLEPVRGKGEFGEALVIFAGAAVEEAR
jgi:hypothetical protein